MSVLGLEPVLLLCSIKMYLQSLGEFDWRAVQLTMTSEVCIKVQNQLYE